jgi:hypothetical protein
VQLRRYEALSLKRYLDDKERKEYDSLVQVAMTVNLAENSGENSEPKQMQRRRIQATPSPPPKENLATLARPSRTKLTELKPSETPSVSNDTSETPLLSSQTPLHPKDSESTEQLPSETPSVSNDTSETPLLSSQTPLHSKGSESTEQLPSETPSVSNDISETPLLSSQTPLHSKGSESTEQPPFNVTPIFTDTSAATPFTSVSQRTDREFISQTPLSQSPPFDSISQTLLSQTLSFDLILDKISGSVDMNEETVGETLSVSNLNNLTNSQLQKIVEYVYTRCNMKFLKSKFKNKDSKITAIRNCLKK